VEGTPPTVQRVRKGASNRAWVTLIQNPRSRGGPAIGRPGPPIKRWPDLTGVGKKKKVVTNCRESKLQHRKESGKNHK